MQVISRLPKSLSPLSFLRQALEVTTVARELVCNRDVFWNIAYWFKMTCLK